MDSNCNRIAGRTFRAVLALLIGLFYFGANGTFAHASLIEIDYTIDTITVSGYVGTSVASAEFDWTSGHIIQAKTFVTSTDFDTAVSPCTAGGYTYTTANVWFDVNNTAGTYCGTKPTGVYYNVFKNTTTNNKFYVSFYWNNVTKTASKIEYNPLATKTKFIDLNVSGTASTTALKITYNIDISEITPETRPDTLAVTITNTESAQIAEKKKIILPLVNGVSSTTLNIIPADYLNSTSTELSDGEYSAFVKFWNLLGQNYTFPTEITANFTISGGVVSSYQIVSQEEAITPFIEPKYQVCSLTNISGCISNAFIFLLYPSQSSINNFTSLYDQLSTRFPFAYFTDFNDSISAIFTNATTANLSITVPFSTLGDIELISASQIQSVPFASLIRTILGAIIWVMLAINIYRRTQLIFNQNHSTT